MSKNPSIFVVGGGIAGMAAALRLADQGYQVSLFERRPILGGRATSHTGIAHNNKDLPPVWVDNCQHVLMRCCTALLEFYTRIGAMDSVEFADTISFVDTQNRWSHLRATPGLPSPLHLLPSMLGFRSLGPIDKMWIVWAMVRMRFIEENTISHTPFSQWLRSAHQTPGSIDNFWQPILVSALNEEPDQTDSLYAFQLFRETLLGNRSAYQVGIPSISLAELYNDRGGKALIKAGVQIHTEVPARRILISDGKAVGIEIDGQEHRADIIVTAVPHTALPGLLDENTLKMPPFDRLNQIHVSPITGIHLWFDRVVTNVPHAAILGRSMHWVFNKGPVTLPGRGTGSYLSLVVSASRDLSALSRSAILKEAVETVHAIFPESRNALLLNGAVLREQHATFSPCPGVEDLRPSSRSPVENLYLAGDWTQTGWPATMEGAVRSGVLAAMAIAQDRATS